MDFFLNKLGNNGINSDHSLLGNKKGEKYEYQHQNIHRYFLFVHLHSGCASRNTFRHHIMPYRASHCVAGFLGLELEKLTCFNVEDRQEIIEEKGKAQLLTTVKNAVDTLTPSIRLFNRREKGLTEWTVNREDDVRDLMYVMLRAAIADIRTEEPVPSRAGTHKFIDIYSEIARLFIEVKWIGKRGSWKQILKQVNDDIQSYVSHPCCDTIIFVIVDEVRDIPDPALIERNYTGLQTINGKEVDIHLFVRDP
jgi:hypothetical protein